MARIVQIISNLGKGGAERLVVDLCNELAKDARHEVCVCVFSETANKASFKDVLEDKVHYINFNKKFRLDLGLQWRLFLFLYKFRPAVVNSHLSGTVLYLYLPMLILRKIKFFHTVHNLAEEEVPNGFFKRLRLLVYKTKRLLPISISQVTLASHNRFYGFPSKLIYNGVKEQERTVDFEKVRKEISDYKKNEDTKVFLSVGRINSSKDQKNYGLLVEVFAKLFERGQNVILLIIGADSSKDQATLSRLVSIKTENVLFLGTKNNVSDYMLNVGFYCSSSKFEGFPITIIEALSKRLPVISTGVGGIPEMITDGENGLLVESFDPENFCNKVMELVNWPAEKIEEVQTANYNKYRANFSISMAAQNYLLYYSQSVTQYPL